MNLRIRSFQGNFRVKFQGDFTRSFMRVYEYKYMYIYSSINCMVYIGFYKSFRYALFKNRRQSDSTVLIEDISMYYQNVHDPLVKISFY